MPRSVASISPFPKACYCCCLQNDDLSETAAVVIDVLAPTPPTHLLSTGLAKCFGFQRRNPLLLAAAQASTRSFPSVRGGGGGVD